MNNWVSIKNQCCCCGGVASASYKERDEVGKSFAEATDVCGDCLGAGCRVLTGGKCEITGNRQAQLSGKCCEGSQVDRRE